MVQFYIYLLVLFVNEESEKNPVNNYTEAHMRVRFQHKTSVYSVEMVFANGEKSYRAKKKKKATQSLIASLKICVKYKERIKQTR